MLNIQKNYILYTVIYRSYQKEWKLINVKLICNLDDKKLCCHITSLKQALNHGLILKKVHRVIKFNQRASLKEYIDMNTEYRMNAKNDFDKDFFNLINNAVFGKTMENVRKHRDISD